MKLLDTLYESILLEYSNKLVNQLVDKFTEQGADSEDAHEYIKLFQRFSQGLPIDKRDITKYSWEELESYIESKTTSVKRIKAGKIGDKNVDKDDIVYNENGIRIFKANSKEQCVRYGNGYNFCISSRGDDNRYDMYKRALQTTPYFIFNDNLPHEDVRRLLVLYNGIERDDHFHIWDALNKGVKLFGSYNSVIETYPWLEGLEHLFV